MKTNLQKTLSVILFTFLGAFFGYAAVPGEPVKAVIIGAALAGVNAVWHLWQAPPTTALGDHEAAVIANIEALMMRRVVSDPNIDALLKRAEAANSLVADAHGAAVAHAFAGHLADIIANSPVAVLQAQLAQTEAIAASTPVEPPPIPANDVTQPKESA